MRHCHRHAATARWLIVVALAILIAPAAFAQTTTQQVTYTWTAPTTGSAVDHYLVQHSINGGAWVQIASVTTLSYVLAATIGEAHQIRVAGVDALSRQGVWSLASDAYTPDPGAPGQPGKPVVTP
ncbi:MAG: hypothetical protein ACYDIE_10160 [Candidatus Krumholzibacteriia bacterium]